VGRLPVRCYASDARLYQALTQPLHISNSNYAAQSYPTSPVVVIALPLSAFGQEADMSATIATTAAVGQPSQQMLQLSFGYQPQNQLHTPMHSPNTAKPCLRLVLSKSFWGEGDTLNYNLYISHT